MKNTKNFICCIMLLTLIGPVSTFAYPNWLELGSYVIEDYQTWNSGSWNLPGGVVSAEALWSAINNHCTNSSRTWRVNLTNYAVTDASLTNPSNNPNYTREMCDFLFIWPHAHPSCLGNFHLASNPQEIGKVSLTLGNVRLGTSYNRWVFDNGCQTLGNYTNFWSDWNNAFEGLQVYYGFVSSGWGTARVGGAMEQWMAEWTNTVNTTYMSNAYFHAMRDQVYQNQLSYSIEPGFLTTKPSSGNSYSYRTYAQASSDAGGDPVLKSSMIFGTPDYTP